jgi:hypothetical protein
MDYSILKEQYKEKIQKIIDDNQKFSIVNGKINWFYFEDENDANVAYSNRNCELYVNICSIDSAYNKRNEPLMIEFFILHEIRHIERRTFVNSMLQGNCLDSDGLKRAIRYKYEFDNYCSPSLNKDVYYQQFIECDAFAFSYSVMKYKYGEQLPDYIFYPKFYDENQIDIKTYIVQAMQSFKARNL